MPFIRGRFVPEVESTGRIKRTLDVLLSLKGMDNLTIATFDELEHLRIYLAAFNPPICEIRLLVPENHPDTVARLLSIGVEPLTVGTSSAVDRIPTEAGAGLTDPLKILLATALDHDADCVVTNESNLLPYVEEFGKAGVLLTSPDFFLRCAEIFVRGHDLPWSFALKVWFEPWMGFYQLSEQWTFNKGMHLLNLCQSKGAGHEAVEFCRSLVLNRLGDLCFTRDRLCFYELQQAASKRARWERQRFSTEVAYYLNFYYMLIYGAFDHAAALVNALFDVGVKERQVAARSQEFLKAMGTKGLFSIRAIFEKPTHIDFLRRVASCRHTAAHRGVLTPAKVVRDLDHPPADHELDEDIRDAGLDYLLSATEPGPIRDGIQGMLRSNARLARYERETLMEDVVLIETDGGYGFINPLNDTWWNFTHCLSFLDDVYQGCVAELK